MPTSLISLSRKFSIFPYRLAPNLSRRLLLNTLFRTKRHKRLSSRAQIIESRAQVKQISYFNEEITTYFWPGSKPPVFLCHGWESRALRFAPLVEKLLADDHSVYAFDGVAHGRSTGNFTWYGQHVDLITHLIKLMPQKPAALIGHSMGGGAITRAAYELDLQAPLVLLAPSYSVQKIMDSVREKAPLHPHILDDIAEELQNITQRKMSELGLDFLKDQMKNSALIFHDKNDRITYLTNSRAVAEKWKSAELIETEGLGHSSIVSHSSVMERICQFLRS